MLESLSWIPSCKYYYDSKSGIILDGSFHLLHVYFVVGHSQFGPSRTVDKNQDELLEINCCCFCKYPMLSILTLSNCMRNLTTLVQNWRIHIVFLLLYNMNGFGTETMYDYYIAMKFMFLVVKLFSHPSIVYASFTILLPWTKHNQHQNHSKPKTFQKPKLQF
jgi:hypothetical protein